jgi:V8-like Glu-specific endopeptidase
MERLEERLVLSSPDQAIGFDLLTRQQVLLPPQDDTLTQAVQHLQVAGRDGAAALSDSIPATPPLSYPENGDGQLLNVHPPDTRAAVGTPTDYPWRTIAQRTSTFPNGSRIGSGALIDPYHILTVGHGVYRQALGGWATSLDITLALNGTNRPFGVAHGVYVRTYTGWVNNEDPHADFALITLDRRVGNFTGWLGYEWYSDDAVYNGMTLNTAGYPGDLDPNQRTMYWETGPSDHADAYEVYYAMSTAGGQSGSPVWRYDGTPTGRYIDAVHAYGADPLNFGTRITQDRLNDLGAWRTEDDAQRPPNDRADLTDYDAWFQTSFAYFSPATVRPGQVLTSRSVAENIGTAAAGAFTTRFYLTTDPNNVTAGYPIGDVALAGDAPFNWQDVINTAALPNNIPAGQYYVGWSFDVFHQVPEFDTTNNTGVITSAQVTVLPAADLINGGFETGDFTGWTQSGDLSYTAVSSDVPVHGGSYAASFGPTGGLGYISQTVATTPGQTYTLSLWLAHPYDDTGTEYVAQIGGTTVDDLVDPGFFPYTQFTYAYTATGTSTTIQLGFYEVPAYWYLDDVSFTASPTPAPHGGHGVLSDSPPAPAPAPQTPVAPAGSTGGASSATAPKVPGVDGLDSQASWEAQRAALVDLVFTDPASKDGAPSFPRCPLRTTAAADTFGMEWLGDGLKPQASLLGAGPLG